MRRRNRGTVRGVEGAGGFRRLLILVAMQTMSGDYNSGDLNDGTFGAGEQMKRTRAMVRWIAGQMVMASAMIGQGVAQDTQYGPKEQQIPPPTCLTLRGAWEGGYTPCTTFTHRQWLAD